MTATVKAPADLEHSKRYQEVGKLLDDGIAEARRLRDDLQACVDSIDAVLPDRKAAA